jgi:uncharacterized protein (TIGR00369 family)
MTPASPRDPRLTEVVERMARSVFHRAAGIELVRADVGAVEVSIVAGDQHRNLFGSLHGGIIATLADTAMGLSVLTTLDAGRTQVTTHLDVAFLAAGGSGLVRARGRVVKVGGRASYAEADIVDEHDRLLARAAASFVATDSPSQ